VKRRQDRDLEDQVFSTRNFFRTLSYREFATSLSLALLLVAIYSTLDYYLNEDWVENNESSIKLTLLCILLPVNHIFYKVEHKRGNNFVGRNFHDHIFLLLFLTLYKLKLFFYGFSLALGSADVASVILFLLVFIIIVMVFESAVAILKRGLKLLRWQIL
jgi:hypothetical protein